MKAAIEKLAKSAADEDAWRFVFLEMRPFVLAIAFRRLKNIAAAEDATQEVLLRILRSRPFEKISEEGAFRSYVWRMALNVVNDHLRSVVRKRSGERSWRVWRMALEGPPTERSTDERDLLLMEEALQLVMDEIEPNDRKFLEMLLQGNSLGETAAALDLSYSNAGVRYHRLKRKLHNLLIEQEK